MARDDGAETLDLTVMIPSRNEAGNIAHAVGDARRVCDDLGLAYEVLVVDGRSEDGTADLAGQAGARVLTQSRSGYGVATREGFEAARGAWILTMDADLSHPPEFIATMWRAREGQALVIASRYVSGGRARMSLFRRALSEVLNRFFRAALGVKVRDLSSGFRLYRREALRSIPIEGDDFAVLQNILARLHRRGLGIVEVPFDYRPRASGSSKARLFRFGKSYLRTLLQVRRLRE
ncbi:MAG: glycosyltransferase [Deltaproteobacteria bacterium]|nr:glycosyltransferase [Deltaproteobacteria bacterium]MCB9479320.1 glycosyltransferase [Deltaproteobacteria bacterium]